MLTIAKAQVLASALAAKADLGIGLLIDASPIM
jgi:hypothetical protein